MRHSYTRRIVLLSLISLYPVKTCSTMASEDTIGPNGIYSAGLKIGNDDLDGSGITIGQVEPFRPGDPTQPNGMNFDTTGSLFNSSVDPAEVFFC